MTTRQYLDSQIDECDAVIAAQSPVIRENAIYCGVLYALYVVLLGVEVIGNIHGAALAASLPGFGAGVYLSRVFRALDKRRSAYLKKSTIEFGVEIANIVIREGDLNIVEAEDGKDGN